MFQNPIYDLILAREPYVFVTFCVGKEAIQHAYPVRVPVNPVVHANQH